MVQSPITTLSLVCYDEERDLFLVLKDEECDYRFLTVAITSKEEFERDWLSKMCRLVNADESSLIEFYLEQLLDSFYYKYYGVKLNEGVGVNRKYSLISLDKMLCVYKYEHGHTLYDIVSKYKNVVI